MSPGSGAPAGGLRLLAPGLLLVAAAGLLALLLRWLGGDPAGLFGPPLAPGTAVRLRLDDGAAVEGELLQVYDLGRSLFGPRRPERWLAVFAAAGFHAAAHQDRSLRFVSASRVRRLLALPGGAHRGGFTRFAAARGLRLERLPLDGNWYVRQDGSGYHRQEAGCGDHAWDLDRGPGGGTALGAEVLSPVAGRVLAAVDRHPDVSAGAPAVGPANNVLIGIAGGYHVGLYHLAKGSVRVQAGQEVQVGTPLGRIGNSGASYGPHLHLGLFWRGAEAPRGACVGWSVPVRFRSLLVGHPAPQPVRDALPAAGEWVSN